MFAECCECFVEEGYVNDGIIIYRLPPFDDVWLSEPHRHEHCIEIEQQRERNRYIQCQNDAKVKCCLEKSRGLLPDLVESDVESDGDNESVSSIPDFNQVGD